MLIIITHEHTSQRSSTCLIALVKTLHLRQRSRNIPLVDYYRFRQYVTGPVKMNQVDSHTHIHTQTHTHIHTHLHRKTQGYMHECTNELSTVK